MAVTTIHIVNAIPLSNLNRDQSGTPKNTMLGGVRRAMLSSQSLKRAARTIFEQETLERSFRSRNLAEEVVDRAKKINPGLDVEKALKNAKKKLDGLNVSSKDKKEKEEGEEDSEKKNPHATAGLILMSNEEVEALAHAIAKDHDAPAGALLLERQTGSLSIAGFGRMFAALTGFSVEAAIAVSPAITTHPALIESDYFSAVDDLPSENNGAGAGHIGSASHTSGVFYRTITIDHGQLAKSWTGVTGDNVHQEVAEMVKALVRGLPTGKKNATAPYTAPVLVLAEEQNYRLAYDFETPVARAQDGGYTETTLARLADEMESVRAFDPDAVGATFAAGAGNILDIGDEQGTLGDLANWVASRVLA